MTPDAKAREILDLVTEAYRVEDDNEDAYDYLWSSIAASIREARDEALEDCITAIGRLPMKIKTTEDQRIYGHKLIGEIRALREKGSGE